MERTRRASRCYRVAGELELLYSIFCFSHILHSLVIAMPCFHRLDRFGYTQQYLDALIGSDLHPAGFKTIIAKEFSPRIDAGVAVPGFLYILEKA